jgi:hypothetical protein
VEPVGRDLNSDLRIRIGIDDNSSANCFAFKETNTLLEQVTYGFRIFSHFLFASTRPKRNFRSVEKACVLLSGTQFRGNTLFQISARLMVILTYLQSSRCFEEVMIDSFQIRIGSVFTIILSHPTLTEVMEFKQSPVNTGHSKTC